MRALVPLQTWASISAVTVADMSRLMQDLMAWAQVRRGLVVGTNVLDYF